MAKKTPDARMLETLGELDEVNRDIGYFIRFCLYHADTVDRLHWGPYYTHADTNLTADERTLANDLSMGDHIGPSWTKEKRRLRRALMLVKRAIWGQAVTLTREQTKKMSASRLKMELNGAWKSTKNAAIQQVLDFSLYIGARQQFAPIFNRLTTQEQDACLEGVSSGLFQGDTSTDKFAADARAALLVLRRLNRTQVPFQGTVRWMDEIKITLQNDSIPTLKIKLRDEWRRLLDSQPENVEMQQVFQEFLAPGPLQFMQRVSVHPMDGAVPLADRWTITDMNALNLPLETRIGFLPRTLREVGALDLVGIESVTRGADIYFLPWKPFRIIKMTIPANAGPGVFFTAAINGCSVFITGNAQSPTVYHAGLEGELKDSYDGDDDDLRPAVNDGNSALFWRTLIKKLEHLSNGDILGEVNRNHYVKRTIAPLAPSIISGDPITERGVAHETALSHQNNIDFKKLMVWGCVFGLRAPNGDWSFYLQENATAYYNDPANGDAYGTSRPLRVNRFFPTPNAITKLSPSGYANLVPNCNFVTTWDGVGTPIPNPFTTSKYLLKNVIY